VIGQLWGKEGAWGVWKGSNAAFLYTVLQSLLENWGRSFLSAIFNVPDMGVREDIDRMIDIASPYPWASLFVAAAAAVATGLALSPLDLVRTRYALSHLGCKGKANFGQTYRYSELQRPAQDASHPQKPPLIPVLVDASTANRP
jgi:hypothetical protein